MKDLPHRTKVLKYVLPIQINICMSSSQMDCSSVAVTKSTPGGSSSVLTMGQFDKLEILEQPRILCKRGFGKGQVTSVGRRHPPKRFHTLLRLENGRMAFEVDVEES